MIAGYESDLFGSDGTVREDLGEHLELRINAVLREIAGNDEMIRIGGVGSLERKRKAIAASSRVEFAAKAQIR
jgi:hypothetical protein